MVDLEHLKEQRKKLACGKEFNDRRGVNTCGQKDWWSIDLCPECEIKHDANVSEEVVE